MLPVSVPCSGDVIISGIPEATMGRISSGVATVANPAPARSAPRAANTAAPLLPREPATIRA